jgi:7,8-dihydropterin-6-yl-methyl-4-(beta-D-ribofuranosyl)aminobenzene 5'-phosphate synthase
MVTEYEKIESNLLIRKNGELLPDILADDLALVIDAGCGMVIITGCAHRGIINILGHVQKITGNESVFAVIGGMHLFRAPEDRIDRTVTALKDMKVRKLGVSHCTGFKASAKLLQVFEKEFFINHAGNCFTLP